MSPTPAKPADAAHRDAAPIDEFLTGEHRALDSSAARRFGEPRRGMLEQLATDVSLRKHHEHEERLLHPALEELLRTESDWRALTAIRRGRSPVPI